MARQKRDPKTVELAKTILENYNPENVDDWTCQEKLGNKLREFRNVPSQSP